MNRQSKYKSNHSKGFNVSFASAVLLGASVIGGYGLFKDQEHHERVNSAVYQAERAEQAKTECESAAKRKGTEFDINAVRGVITLKEVSAGGNRASVVVKDRAEAESIAYKSCLRRYGF